MTKSENTTPETVEKKSLVSRITTPIKKHPKIAIAIAAGAGLCLAALPCMIGDRMPAMQRCFPPQPELGGELWLVVRDELREVAHVRAFIDALIAHIGPLRPVLEGAGEVASAAEPA